MDIVDPEMVEYPEAEVLRYIKVALYCTQAASHHRPNMKRIVDMLSNEVELEVKTLTQPDIYKTHSNENTSSSRGHEDSPQGRRGRKSMLQNVTPARMMRSFATITQLQPR